MLGLVIPAAGRGSRFGSTENKIWSLAAGRTVLDWTLHAFDSHPEVDCIVISGTVHELERLQETGLAYKKLIAVVEGGASRQESVQRGLAALPPACEIVLVHDAARPAVSHDLISRIILGVKQYGAAVPGLPICDTIKRTGTHLNVLETIPRDGLYAVQTPQGARFADLLSSYTQLENRIHTLTDEAGLLEAAGFPVHVLPGEERNIKVTLAGDLERVEEILNPKKAITSIRTGFGYDVHAFAIGRDLWLGGVKIPYSPGLLGHSDADVLLHAVCDALLGAASMGDIGVLFPDTEKVNKDRPSVEFIREARRLLTDAGWIIQNLDVALLAEEPRIGPYREQIISIIAQELKIAVTQVNLKATTSEKMGFVGRKEGIACWAVTTITRS